MLGQPHLLVRCMPGELYMAGLLHDIGKVIFAIHLPEVLEFCTKKAQEDHTCLYQAERAAMEIDHAAIGALQLDQWNLPEPILGAVRYHHDPSQAPEPHQELSALIQFANVIAHMCEPQPSGSKPLYQLDGCWLHQQGESPLAQPERRQPVIKEIIQTLLQKEKYMDENPEEKTEEASQDAPRSRRATKSQPVRAASRSSAPPRRGLWRRLVELFT